MAIENANPTILAQLPTRQPRQDGVRRKTGPGHEFDSMLYQKPVFMREPFQSQGVPKEIYADDWWHEDDNESLDAADEPIDDQEIYDLIANISDPEHPFSLGQLAVVNLQDIKISPPSSAPLLPHPNQLVQVQVDITPTISHCSHATIIGLAVRVRLERCLPPNYRVDVRIRQGTHAQDDQVTKQLADKERVAAALENDTLVGVLNNMLKGCE